MSKVLCVYYTRTGHTREIFDKISKELNADVVELQDDRRRHGIRGYLNCAMDAVRHASYPLFPVETKQPINTYDLVVLGTPVWAGRCSSLLRSFLKGYGMQLRDVALVVNRSSSSRYEDIMNQVDLYLPQHVSICASIRYGDVGCDFWVDDFIRRVKSHLEEKED